MDRNSDNTVAFDGGSFRENAGGKGIYRVIPPAAIRRVAQRYEYGEDKYGESDAFMAGMPTSRSFDSAMRHLWSYLEGDNSEDHLAACVWNCFAIMEMEMNHTKWQDLKSRQPYADACSVYPRYEGGK